VLGRDIRIQGSVIIRTRSDQWEEGGGERPASLTVAGMITFNRPHASYIPAPNENYTEKGGEKKKKKGGEKLAPPNSPSFRIAKSISVSSWIILNDRARRKEKRRREDVSAPKIPSIQRLSPFQQPSEKRRGKKGRDKPQALRKEPDRLA